MKNIFVLFCACIALIGCTSTPKVDTITEADTIRNLDSQWAAAIKDKNVENVMNLIASDAVFMIDDLPIIDGKEAIRESQVSWYSDTTIVFSTYTGTSEAIEVSASGDLAYSRGIERYNQNTPNGTIERVSKWVDIWKKIDSEWKVIVVIGNSDKPL